MVGLRPRPSRFSGGFLDVFVTDSRTSHQGKLHGVLFINDYMIRILQQYMGQKFKIITIIMNYQNTRKRSILFTTNNKYSNIIKFMGFSMVAPSFIASEVQPWDFTSFCRTGAAVAHRTGATSLANTAWMQHWQLFVSDPGHPAGHGGGQSGTKSSSGFWKPGIHFAQNRLLRLGIIFYGFRLSFQAGRRRRLDGSIDGPCRHYNTFVGGYLIGTRWLKIDRGNRDAHGCRRFHLRSGGGAATEPVVPRQTASNRHGRGDRGAIRHAGYVFIRCCKGCCTGRIV